MGNTSSRQIRSFEIIVIWLLNLFCFLTIISLNCNIKSNFYIDNSFIFDKKYNFAHAKRQQVMAIAIKNIPVLNNASAKAFVKQADNASKKTTVVNFSSQVKSAKNILDKAKLK